MHTTLTRFVVLLPSSIVCSVFALMLSFGAPTKAENIRTAMWIAPVAPLYRPDTSYHLIACTSSQENACAAQLKSCMKPVELIRDPYENEASRRSCERAETKCLERCGMRFPGR